jgi:hypothetical protein
MVVVVVGVVVGGEWVSVICVAVADDGACSNITPRYRSLHTF